MTDITRVVAAAEAVIRRWDSPDWKDEKHTADYIAALRDAVQGLRDAEPVAPDAMRELVEALRGRQRVLVDLLRQAVGPLEVSAAVMEDEDPAHLDGLIASINNALRDIDATEVAALAKHKGTT